MTVTQKLNSTDRANMKKILHVQKCVKEKMNTPKIGNTGAVQEE